MGESRNAGYWWGSVGNCLLTVTEEAGTPIADPLGDLRAVGLGFNGLRFPDAAKSGPDRSRLYCPGLNSVGPLVSRRPSLGRDPAEEND